MRVIAGTHRGRRLYAPQGMETRPTADRVKEALFSMIGPELCVETCLDLYAGSGALGIEALSRGVHRADFVDVRTADIIARNLRQLGLTDRAAIHKLDACVAIRHFAARCRRFDVVFADPPYRSGLIEGTLAALVQASLLHERSCVVAEVAASCAAPVTAGLHLLRERTYGAARVCIFQPEDRA
jgi:16S rRNA (guanine(966)-N(2))-methyltransferase RsmD